MHDAELTAALPYIEARMNFSGTVEGRPRVDFPDFAASNMAMQPHDLRIHDARPIAGALSLDREGFIVVPSPTRLDAGADMAGAAAGYQAAVAAQLAELTGASLVLPQGKGLIKRTMQEGDGGPSRWVHMDYTAAAARLWVEWIEQWEGRPLRHYPRFAVYQTWRCLTPPPCDNTLAFCDSSSIDPADLIVFDAAVRAPYDEPGNVFESYWSRFSPGQRWYYFPDLVPEEMIVFKGFDSDPERDAQPLHNSVDLPAGAAPRAPRVSVEARFFAFYR
jgi:hypothetical protein